jgi:hypothetical protein
MKKDQNGVTNTENCSNSFLSAILTLHIAIRVKNMQKLLPALLILSLFSCGSVTMSNGRQKVIIKPQQSPCDIHRKEIDPNCTVEGKNVLPKQMH